MTTTKSKEKIKIGQSFEHQGIIFIATSFPTKKLVCGDNNDIRIKTPRRYTIHIDKIIIL